MRNPLTFGDFGERVFYAKCPDLSRAYVLDVGSMKYLRRTTSGPCGPFCQHWVEHPAWRVALNVLRKIWAARR